MVVAAGTGDRKAHEATADEVDAVVDNINLIVQKSSAHSQITHGSQVIVIVFDRQFVGCNLLNDELVVGQVVIEGSNDVITVCKSIWVTSIFDKDIAFGIGIAGQVEPVTAETFAEMGAGQETVDES